MKNVMLMLVALLFVSCERITVLEVCIIYTNPEQEIYRVMYEVDYLGASEIRNDIYYTPFSVNTFIYEIADDDLSLWVKN